MTKTTSITQTLDKGWSWIVMLACFCTFFLIGANILGVGIMNLVLLERYGENVLLTAWAGSLHTAFAALGGPLSSFLVDKYSCRTAVVLSGLVFTAGYLGTAFAPNIQTTIFTLGIVAGSGAGLGYTSSIVVIGFNFKTKRDTAVGFALSGLGAGLFAVAPLMQLAAEHYGTTGFFIIQAAISLNIVVFWDHIFS
ncbi:monocarboxylate transporter 9-like [Ruditapes philippinarum]|uniref:monocarboxylate transporter 9-like n=1 Tax=Ruditapes philippinarum TaxID=129788 RepID=UPI00295A6A2B|nr:monocarboxylate transporter 9-like [Ruditapes philippinarum]